MNTDKMGVLKMVTKLARDWPTLCGLTASPAEIVILTAVEPAAVPSPIVIFKETALTSTQDAFVPLTTAWQLAKEFCDSVIKFLPDTVMMLLA